MTRISDYIHVYIHVDFLLDRDKQSLKKRLSDHLLNIVLPYETSVLLPQ